MRILDRQRYWAFLKAYVVCFVALVGLYIVIDAFTNLDEFSERSDTLGELFRNMGYYYLIKMSGIFDKLCGVISMMAAIFTVTWMQRDNELIAMLAAGISTHRVIRPVIISTVLVSSLAIINQEWIIPPIAEELQKPPDDDGKRVVLVAGRHDSNEIYFTGMGADRSRRTVLGFRVTIPVKVAGKTVEVTANEATYFGRNATQYPIHGGWLLRNVKFETASAGEIEGIFTKVPDATGFPPPLDPKNGLPEAATYFLKSDCTFAAVTRNRQWYMYAPTRDLIQAMYDPSNRGDRRDIEVFLHTRLIRPLTGLCLMCLSLPLVLGGAGRNMFVNLGLSLGTSGVFYAFLFMCSYFGGLGALSSELAAWLPLFIFGVVAVIRWDKIQT